MQQIASQQVISLLENTALFAGFSKDELALLLARLQGVQRQYAKGQALWLAGDEVTQLGIVLEGSIEAVKHTRAGVRFPVSHMGPGGVFGDVLAAGRRRSPVSVLAGQHCRVLLISYRRLLAGDAPAEPHRRLLANLLAVLSDKYFALDARVELLLVRRLRHRIAAYLLAEAAAANANQFAIALNRGQLADYLGCERSALSRELSRMARDGLLRTRGSHFELLNLPALEALH